MDRKDAFVFNTNGVAGMNTQVGGTEHAGVIRYGIYARLTGRSGSDGSGCGISAGKLFARFAKYDCRQCEQSEKENNKQPGKSWRGFFVKRAAFGCRSKL